MAGIAGTRRIWLLAGAAMCVFGVGIALAAKGDGHDARIKLAASNGTRVSISAKCGKGKHAIGGGIEPRDTTVGRRMIANGPDQVSHRRAKAWFGDMSATDTEQMRVLAVCSKHTDALVHTRNFAINDGGSKTLTCKRGTSAISGGVRYRNADAGRTPLLRITTDGPLDSTGKLSKTKDGDKPKKWRVAVEFPTGGHLDLKAYVVCSKRAHARLETTAFTINDNEGFGELANCRGSKVALGGGIVGSPSRFGGVRASAPRGKAGDIINTGSGDRPKKWFAMVDGPLVTKGGVAQGRYKVMAVCG